jgi:hypothetical protein
MNQAACQLCSAALGHCLYEVLSVIVLPGRSHTPRGSTIPARGCTEMRQ